MTPYYTDGTVTLYHADCREAWYLIGGHKPVVAVTDPPYGIDYESNGVGKAPWKRKQAVRGDEDVDLREWFMRTWGKRPALVFGSWKTPVPSGTKATLVWDKGLASGMGDTRIPWKPNWECIYVLGDGFEGPRTSSVLTGYWVHSHYTDGGRLHPCEKPVSLMHALLQKCPPGTLLDPFAGSGSTLVAAKNLGRSAVGIEIDERYCEISARRLSQEVLPSTREGS